MFDQPVDLLHRGAGSGGDALAARGVQQPDRDTLFSGHRQDDRFLTTDHRIINTGSGDLLLHLAESGQHAHDAAKSAHFLKLAKLRQEIVHVELALCHALGEAFGFFLLDILRRLFDKCNDIAHVENTTGKPRRIKLLQRVLLFADTDKLDWAAGDLAHRQRRTTARITVKTGQHNAGDVHGLIEGGGGCHRVLAGHRIGDKKHLMRIGQRLDLAKLGHQPFIDGHPARRIKDQHVIALKLGRLQGAFGNLRRTFAIGLGKHANLGLFTENAELLARGRAGHVKRRQHHLLALLRAQPQRQLAGGGRLSRTLEAGHQDDRRRAHLDVQWRRIGSQYLDQRVIDDLDNLLVGTHRFQHIRPDSLVAHRGNEALHHGKRNIGVEKRQTHFTERRINIRFAQRPALAKSAEDVLQLVLQIVEHGASGTPVTR